MYIFGLQYGVIAMIGHLDDAQFTDLLDENPRDYLSTKEA